MSAVLPILNAAVVIVLVLSLINADEKTPTSVILGRGFVLLALTITLAVSTILRGLA